jgi:hypothetical protein
MTLSISESDAVASTVTEAADAQTGDSAPGANPLSRPPRLAELLTQAEAEQPDATAIAQAELSEILRRADHPAADDGQRLLALAGTLGIDRKTIRAAVETVAGWNRQRERVQAEVGRLEARQAELSAQIADLEAKRQALELPDGYAALHALAAAGVAHMLKTRAPGLTGGFLNYASWTSDRFGFNKDNHRTLPPMSAARKECLELLRGETAGQIIADLARRNVQRGGVASGCSIDQLVEADL